jgi:glycosyltransferase involved in cell wall biosynthesis
MSGASPNGSGHRPRLLFLSTVHPSPTRPTTGLFNARMLDGLSREWEVTAITPVPGHRGWRRPGGYAAPPNYRNLAPRFWYPPGVLPQWQSTGMVRAAHRALGGGSGEDARPDLVLAYWAYPDADAAGELARRWGVPSVAILGGSDLLIHARRGGRDERLIRRAIARQDRIYTLGEHLREAAIALGANPATTSSFDRGVDRTVFHPGVPEDHSAGEGTLLVWAGRMEPVKNLDLLLDALHEPALGQHRSTLRVVLVGEGSARARIARRIAAEDLPVTLAGPCTAGELAARYRRADVVALTSPSEGTPNVLLEAAACGTAFVTTAVGGAGVLADRLGGTGVPPGDPAALAVALAHQLVVPRGLWCPAARLPDAADAIGRLSGELTDLLRKAR